MSSVRSRSGGQVDPDHVEAVEQVGAEPARLDLVLEALWLAAMIRTSTWIVSVPPTRSNVPGLKHAEQLGLEGRGDVAGLVEQQRAAVGQLEPPDLPPLGAR